MNSFLEGMFSISSRRDSLCQPKATPWEISLFFSFVALKGQLKTSKMGFKTEGLRNGDDQRCLFTE